MPTRPRSPAQITLTTWQALFLRAAVSRLSASRFAWFWMFAEPLAFIVLLMVVFTFLRVRNIGGISTAVWIMAGVLTFHMFRRTAASTMVAVRGVKSLYMNPQIRPFDTLVVTAALEGFVMVIVSILLLSGATFIGLKVIPAEPLAVLEALLGVWLFGLGYGLITSVAMAVVPPIGTVLAFILRPLWILSGVLLPVTQLPYPARGWFLINPLVHGLEAARFGFAPYYHVPAEISISYLYMWALGAIFLGLALQVRYANRLVKQK
jgi:capsular polysaccharide transport system permease protein